MELALDSTGRQLEEQGRMPDDHKLDIHPEMAVMILRASTIVGKVEAACPR